MTPIFISHGSPMNGIEDNDFTKSLANWSATNPQPDLILAVSAHWVTKEITLNTASKHTTLHDFGGFPPELFAVRYEPAGKPDFLVTMEDILQIKIQTETQRGLDHGIWTVLKSMYPQANVPVIQLSLGSRLSLQEHFELGQKLANLPDKTLLLASGNLTHNLGDIRWNNPKPVDYAVEFDTLIKKAIENQDYQALVEVDKLGNLFYQNHPSIEHYVPLLYATGAASIKQNKPYWIYEGIEMGTLSMRSVGW